MRTPGDRVGRPRQRPRSRERGITALKRLTRRDFLTTTAAAVAVPTIIPSSAFGANERVVTGHIGIGRQGKNNLATFLKLAPVAAVCDVDRAHLDDAVEQVKDAGKTC